MNGLMAMAEDNAVTETIYSRRISVPYFNLAVDHSHNLE